MPKAIGYIRVSTQGQADEGVSLEAQKAKIQAWCIANDYELAGMFTDAGISGTSMEKREGLQAALSAATKGMAMVAYSISRLARSTRDMLSMADALKRRGVDLVSLTEKIDTTNASGKFFFTLMAAMSEFERDQISDRTKAALAHKKAAGEKYAPVPFGYREVEGRLIEVKKEAAIVAEIIRMRSRGVALKGIADHLNETGVAGKRGGKWFPSTVRYVLQRTA